MKVMITVKTNAKRNDVRVQDDGNLLVSVSAPPVEGKANKKVIEVLADYFRKPKSRIVILKGLKGKNKIVEVL